MILTGAVDLNSIFADPDPAVLLAMRIRIQLFFSIRIRIRQPFLMHIWIRLLLNKMCKKNDLTLVEKHRKDCLKVKNYGTCPNLLSF